jgi:hypothetical protein
MIDPSTTGRESKVDPERIPPPANGSGEEGRNPTTNATTMTNHEETAAGAAD